MAKNNFYLQEQLNTYKTASEIEQAIELLKEIDFAPSTIKFLETFRSTLGATHRKIETLWKKAGISKTTYYDRVLPELREKLGENLIAFITAPMKKAQNRKKLVQSSKFKVLAPLLKIKQLVSNYLEKQAQDLRDALAQAFSGTEIEPESGTTTQAETPSESKAEETFSNEQISLEKDLSKDLNKLFNITGGKFKIKKAIQNYIFKFPVFRDFALWSKSKQYEIANALQMAVIKTNADIEEPRIKHMIKNAVASCFETYGDKPQNQLVKLIYTCIFNAIKPEEDRKMEDSFKDLEDSAAHVFEDEIAKKEQYERDLLEIEEIMQKLREPRKTESERLQERRELDDLGVY